jgi:hypothetical protein
MPLVLKNLNKTHKLNYLFSYLSILLPLRNIIIYLQLLSLVTCLDVIKPHNIGLD